MKLRGDGLGVLLDAYGALFLARRRVVGLLVLAATLCDPATGACGLIAGLTALATRAALRLPGLPGEAEILNAVYVGLALGAFHGLEPRLLALAALGGTLAVPLATALRQTLAGPPGARGLPLLGAPFVGTAWTLFAVARALGVPLRSVWAPWPGWLPALPASALAHVGALFYVIHPVAGLLVLMALLQASRALAVLALGGGLLAHTLVVVAGASPASGLPLLAAFNGALVALVIGGLLAEPSLRTLAVATGGVVVASALSAGMLALSAPFGVPPLSAPFLLTVWLTHAALRPETSAFWARFWLAVPQCPEEKWVAARLATARGLAAGSVALRPPYAGGMDVAQGVDGAHTHRGPWRYALDFVRLEAGRSYRNDGRALSDFFAFDGRVDSPAWGTVAACRGDILDNAPGDMNLALNWGNHVLIDIGGGLYVLLAHLRQGSLKVATGQVVAPGTPLGRCGNSGRSAQPHIHLHVQRGSWLGAPTVPFHLAHCVVDGEYALDVRPPAGCTVEAALRDDSLSEACAPRGGRVWVFADGDNLWRLTAETALLGETALVSERGGRVRTVAGDGLWALHSRSGTPDVVLDAFTLAFGLTPCVAHATRWRDAPTAAVLPLPAWLKVAVALSHPWGANLDSRYDRQWDRARGLWRQHAHHRLGSAQGEICAESIGWLSESLGPVGFSLSMRGQTVVDAALAVYGHRGDHGVPAWSTPCPLAAPS